MCCKKMKKWEDDVFSLTLLNERREVRKYEQY